MSPDGQVAAANLGLVYPGLGDDTPALDDLEQAHDDAICDPLRSEPRFIALMQQLNFLK